MAAFWLATTLLSACTSDSGAPAPTSGHPTAASASPTAPPDRDEALVRSLVTDSVDRIAWVRAPAARVLTTYFAPGQRYLGGQLVGATDEIVVIKMHGTFTHSAPHGGSSSASLALSFVNATTGQRIPFVQLWDDGAPDLGIGPDPGTTNRGLAVKLWDLRLIGSPVVRAV